MEHFQSYIGGEKVLSETCHLPKPEVKGRTSVHSQMASWMMALQGSDIEIKYAQNNKIPLGQGLAESQLCDCEGQATSPSLLVTTPSLPSSHHYHEENVCQGFPKVFVEGCSFHHASQIKAGVGIVWTNQTVREPN